MTSQALEARQQVLDDLDTEGFATRAPHMIVNYDHGERLDPAELGDGPRVGQIAGGAMCGVPGGVQTVLTVLLAASSHGWVGRGDFPTNSGLVGSWAGCRIGVVPVSSRDVPRQLVSVTGQVREVLEEAHLASYRVGADGQVERTWDFIRGRDRYLRRYRRRPGHRRASAC